MTDLGDMVQAHFQESRQLSDSVREALIAHSEQAIEQVRRTFGVPPAMIGQGRPLKVWKLREPVVDGQGWSWRCRVCPTYGTGFRWQTFAYAAALTHYEKYHAVCTCAGPMGNRDLMCQIRSHRKAALLAGC